MIKFIRGNAAAAVPKLVQEWLTAVGAGSNNSFKPKPLRGSA
jgi:hypothetical protein